MKINVAYDQNGRIVAAAEAGAKYADLPAGGRGLTVAELEMPKELTGKKFGELVNKLHVDVQTRQLVVER